jgi:sugar phosphate isomerase/epimerase
MQLDLPGSPHLTYCTNVHAGESWSDIEQALSTHLPAVKRLVSPTKPMGIGLRLSGAAAADLGEPRALAGLVALLKQADLYVFTINAFPYGSFHGTRVKEKVYEPDWRQEGRLHFTNHVANIMARLLPEGTEGSISTVPGAYKANVAGEADIARMADAMVRHAAHLHSIARATGKQIALALEPEPCCFLETTDEAIAFFEEHLFARSAVEQFCRVTHVSAPDAADALRRHLGVCLDVCHAAVEFEDPVDSVERLEAAGIRVAKIQLSSALKLTHVGADAPELLLPFDDGVYLHQTIQSRDGNLTRYADLPDALAALHSGDAGGEWRVHCHVPLFQSNYGALQSTQDTLAKLLTACRTRSLTPHLEVETYTWGVLPAHMRDGDLGSDIARELTWVRSQLSA